MTTLRPSSTVGHHRWARGARVAALSLAVMTTLVACSSSAGDEPSGSAPQPAAADDAATEASDAAAESTDDEDTSGAPDAGGVTSDDVGNATLHVNGIEFPDFAGDCEISRQNGKEDVGDLNAGDIVTIIGIDNVEAHEESAMNYVALNEESFTFRDLTGAAGVDDPSAKGEITTLTELGPRTADGSRDIVEVRFAGVLTDGTSLDADVVCELQNAF